MPHDSATDPISTAGNARATGNSNRWIAWAALCCVVLVSGGFWFSQPSWDFGAKKSEEREEGIAYMLDQTQQFAEAQWATTADGGPKPIETAFSPDSNATGSMAIYQEFMSDILNQSAELTNDYVAELEAVGWSGILDPHRLEADVGFEESRRLLEAGRTVAEKYKARGLQIITAMEDRIQDLELNPAEKRGFAQGFKQGAAKSMATHEQIWGLELATIDEFGKMVDYLAQEPRFWTADDGQFVFDTQEQVDQFNGYLATINSLVERQKALQQGVIDAQREKLGAL